AKLPSAATTKAGRVGAGVPRRNERMSMIATDVPKIAYAARMSRRVTLRNRVLADRPSGGRTPFTSPFVLPMPFTRPFVRPTPLANPFVRPIPLARPFVRPREPFTTAPRAGPFPDPSADMLVNPWASAKGPFISGPRGRDRPSPDTAQSDGDLGQAHSEEYQAEDHGVHVQSTELGERRAEKRDSEEVVEHRPQDEAGSSDRYVDHPDVIDGATPSRTRDRWGPRGCGERLRLRRRGRSGA